MYLSWQWRRNIDVDPPSIFQFQKGEEEEEEGRIRIRISVLLWWQTTICEWGIELSTWIGDHPTVSLCVYLSRLISFSLISCPASSRRNRGHQNRTGERTNQRSAAASKRRESCFGQISFRRRHQFSLHSQLKDVYKTNERQQQRVWPKKELTQNNKIKKKLFELWAHWRNILSRKRNFSFLKFQFRR